MFFVISTLLGGKRKVEVQEFSSKQNLIPLLSEYIDYLDWGNIHEESTRPIFNTDGINLQDENSYHVIFNYNSCRETDVNVMLTLL